MGSRRSASALATTIACVIAVAALASPANARPQDDPRIEEGLRLTEQVLAASDPVAAHAALSAYDKELFALVNEVAHVAETTRVERVRASDLQGGGEVRAAGGVTALASSCYAVTKTRTATSAVGNGLYTYWHRGGWCHNGTTVTSGYKVEAGAQTLWPGWKYSGVVTDGARVVNNEGRSFTQFKFDYSWGVVNQQVLPCTRIRGMGTRINGQTPPYSWDSVCSVY